MAFRQHARPPAPRQLSFSNEAGPSAEPLTLTSPSSLQQRRNTLDSSEEWVLFSPSVAPSTTRTHTTSTERTPRTAGLSRLSDFGSLDTAAHSDQQDDDEDNDEEANLTAHGSEVDDDAEDMDSLDDGLHAFHEPSEYGGSIDRRLLADQSNDTVLPTHDGLGTFPASSSMLQEQLWQFEARPGHRKRPHTRRRSSVQRTLDALEEGQELLNEERERRQRIEKWRLDQSIALLEEIERETRRRRRMSVMSAARSHKSRADSVTTDQQQEERTAAIPAPRAVSKRQAREEEEEEEELSRLQRFTRKVIRDLMGIDENILSVIFGEALPEEAELSTTPTPSSPQSREFLEILESGEDNAVRTDSWQHRILERIARELGVLVHHLSEHPGAFDTYLRTREPLPYAGLTPTAPAPSQAVNIEPPSTASNNARRASINPQNAAIFTPTLEVQQPATTPYSEASLWGIEEEPDTLEPVPEPVHQQPPQISEAQRMEQERQYWERDLDAKMVFRFLLRRFSSRTPSPTGRNDGRGDDTYSSTNLNSHGFNNPARRAALIRQNHPLVARSTATATNTASITARPSSAQRRDSFPSLTAEQSRRRDLLHRHHPHHHRNSLSNGATQSSPLRVTGRPRGSSCASQSTKRSRKSGSSRNYWDVTGSVGSASGVGVWGEA